MSSISRACAPALAAALLLAPATEATATVVVTGPDNGNTFFGLFQPTGEFDERGLSGFEYLISSKTGDFTANDQYLISGENTDVSTSLGADLGQVGNLSGVKFDFSLQHNLLGGRNFTFLLTNTLTQQTTGLCWGLNCAAGTTATQILNGIPPISDYNGIQLQVRAQEVSGSSAAVKITALTGVTVTGEPFFDEVVDPTSPGTIASFTPGRRGQWFIGDNLDLVVNEWELTGEVTLTRPDDALVDRTKVRLAIDFVRDPSKPFLPVPEPSTGVLGVAALTALCRLGTSRRHRARALRDDAEVG